MHQCRLARRFVKWSRPRQTPWVLILVWHWRTLRLNQVSTLQPFLQQTRSDQCRSFHPRVSGLKSWQAAISILWTHKITSPPGWRLFVIYRVIILAIPESPVITKAQAALPIMGCMTTLKITSTESIALRDDTKVNPLLGKPVPGQRC